MHETPASIAHAARVGGGGGGWAGGHVVVAAPAGDPHLHPRAPGAAQRHPHLRLHRALRTGGLRLARGGRAGRGGGRHRADDGQPAGEPNLQPPGRAADARYRPGPQRRCVAARGAGLPHALAPALHRRSHAHWGRGGHLHHRALVPRAGDHGARHPGPRQQPVRRHHAHLAGGRPPNRRRGRRSGRGLRSLHPARRWALRRDGGRPLQRRLCARAGAPSHTRQPRRQGEAGARSQQRRGKLIVRSLCRRLRADVYALLHAQGAGRGDPADRAAGWAGAAAARGAGGVLFNGRDAAFPARRLGL